MLGPDILDGVAGKRLKLKHCAVLVPQPFTAATVTFPLEKLEGKLTVILVPLLVKILAPCGTVQLYELAFETAAIEYVNTPPPQRLFAGPDIAAGIAGRFLLKVRLRAELCPQPFTALTLKAPPVNPTPKLKVILLLPAPAVIVVPAGIVHK